MPASVVANKPTLLRTRTSLYRKQDNVSRKSWVTCKSHPWCGSSTGIYPRWVAKHNWIATLYSTASSFGAAVPLHKAPQHLQSRQGTSFTVRVVRTGFECKATMPASVAQAILLFSVHQNLRLCEKKIHVSHKS